MEETIILIIFIICFLGVWVTRLSRKITQLEHELVVAQKYFEEHYRDVLLIIQKNVDTQNTAYTNLTELVSKQVVKNMEAIGKLEGKFNDLRRYVVNELYKPKKEGEQK